MTQKKNNMKPILRSWFKQFCEDWYNTQAKDRSEEDYRFEAFCNYYVINSAQKASHDPSDFMTADSAEDKTDDYHIDGVGVFVNGVLCENLDALESAVEHSSTIEVSLHLVQSKNGKKNIDSGDIHKFITAAKQFVIDEPWDDAFVKAFDINDRLVDYQKVFAESLAQKYVKKPKVSLHWCVSNRNDAKSFENDVSASVRTAVSELDCVLQDFVSEVTFTFYGAEDLVEKVGFLNGQNECEFSLCGNPIVNFPSEINDLADSFFAFVPGVEFLKIICPDGQTMDHSLFNENIRDFQGVDTIPYQGMSKTLSSEHGRGLFAFMNNGVTIVAADINGASRIKKLTNYQIVNGCQTSYALYDHRDNLENVFVPVRVIKTATGELLDDVTFSTNSQNNISVSDMVARTKTARALEDFCKPEDIKFPIVFERRSGQFNRVATKIPRRRILPKKEFTSAYVACVMQRPHSAIGYFDRYQNGGKDDIWIKGTPVSLLYASAYLVMQINEQKLHQGETSLKYHLAASAFKNIFGKALEHVDEYWDADPDSPERFQLQDRINTEIERNLYLVDNVGILKRKLQSGINAIPEIRKTYGSSLTKVGKLSRATTKTEQFSQFYFRITSSSESSL